MYVEYTAGVTLCLSVMGTSLMGSNLTKCLVNQGYSVIVYNRSRWKAEKLRERLGIKVANNPKELLGQDKTAIAFISGDNALYDVIHVPMYCSLHIH